MIRIGYNIIEIMIIFGRQKNYAISQNYDQYLSSQTLFSFVFLF